MLSRRNFILFASEAVKAGNNPDPLSFLKRVLTRSWNNKRLYFVAFTFQINAHLLEDHSVCVTNKSENIFSDDPCRPALLYNSIHRRP